MDQICSKRQESSLRGQIDVTSFVDDSSSANRFIHDDNRNNQSTVECLIWRSISISGVLHETRLFGMGWWYRIQFADETIAKALLDDTQIFGRSLKNYATFWFPLPRATYRVIWAPQWVPEESISREMRAAFWKRMPPRFWSLASFFEGEIIWREEMDRCTTFSGSIIEHLCTQNACTICESPVGVAQGSGTSNVVLRVPISIP